MDRSTRSVLLQLLELPLIVVHKLDSTFSESTFSFCGSICNKVLQDCPEVHLLFTCLPKHKKQTPWVLRVASLSFWGSLENFLHCSREWLPCSLRGQPVILEVAEQPTRTEGWAFCFDSGKEGSVAWGRVSVYRAMVFLGKDGCCIRGSVYSLIFILRNTTKDSKFGYLS